jgi:alkylhydroperoxidase/carboxymuconolactone decarboxylase family protein
MATYYDPSDLPKFSNITRVNKDLGNKFFSYYNSVMAEGALIEKEKSLIALAVAHALKCPYCIEAFTSSCIEKGADEEQMNEVAHGAKDSNCQSLFRMYCRSWFKLRWRDRKLIT